MRTLIFGGTGMLGSALVAELRRRSRPALGLSHAQGDITDPDDLRSWMRSFRPQVVINCAAFTKVDDCEEREEHAGRINGEAVAEVAAAVDEAGAKLIQISTDYVFDGTATEPYAEDAVTGPRSAYGRSKLLGEENALAHPRNLVVRVSWLFGPGGPNFVATMLRLMASGHRTLRVVDDQVGGPTYTVYLARALADLAATDAAGIVHYQNQPPVSWYGFTREIVRLWDPEVEVLPVTSNEFPRPAPRPAYSVLDVSRCEQLLGRPAESWSAGLAEYLATLRARSN
jgi:dTDP-4-dehydrorhamnose reductase